VLPFDGSRLDFIMGWFHAEELEFAHEAEDLRARVSTHGV
jgi:hypothetical protein